MPVPKLPGWFHVTSDAGLNGRTGPSATAPIRYRRPKGYDLYVRKRVVAGGRAWLVSRTGTHYAEEFLAPGKAGGPRGGRIASPVPSRRVTTPWGKKPKNNTYWQARGHHTGDDYAAPAGTDVVAVLKGKVVPLRDHVLGTVALLYADNGKTYWYCHLSKITKANKRVRPGEVIGRVGASGTGARFGPHLHFEIRDGHSTSWGGRDRAPVW